MPEVLDKGFVELVDSMGDDSSIVQAARVSYGAGTKTKRSDSGLIKYLMRNDHRSPFEMVEFKFHIKAPLFVARQLMRHRTASVNEISGRYSEIEDEFYIPAYQDMCYQSTDNKQGRGDAVPIYKAVDVINAIEKANASAYAEYNNLLDIGIAKELARAVLPLNIYTRWYWKIDLHNLLHFLSLRLDSHAQLEIRKYAQAILGLIKPIVPVTLEAWENKRDATHE